MFIMPQASAHQVRPEEGTWRGRLPETSCYGASNGWKRGLSLSLSLPLSLSLSISLSLSMIYIYIYIHT